MTERDSPKWPALGSTERAYLMKEGGEQLKKTQHQPFNTQTHMHLYIPYTCTHVTYAHIHAHTCINTRYTHHISIHTWHAHVSMHTWQTRVYTYCTLTHLPIHHHTWTDMLIHTCTYIHTYIYTHTHDTHTTYTHINDRHTHDRHTTNTHATDIHTQQKHTHMTDTYTSHTHTQQTHIDKCWWESMVVYAYDSNA